jgi:hypothetical protein
MLVVKQMARYTDAEYIAAYFMYGFSNGNALAAVREYQLWYLE